MNRDLVDPCIVRPGTFDAYLVTWINDPRDLPFLRLMASCAVVACLGVGMFFTGRWVWYLAPLYWAVWGLWVLDRFILMLHCTSHRTLFNTAHRAYNYVIPWVLCPFMGQTPDTYFAHHLGMHHPENNLSTDLSTTVRYQRDRPTAWLHYYLSFLLVGLPALAAYHRRKGNTRLLVRTIVGEGSFVLLCALLAMVNLRATLVVFVIPVVLVRALMMAGNWGQHAFVDVDDPGNAYRNSITCINTRYNRRCFNDGYHIHHHVKARCHWTEYPLEYETNKSEYGRQDAVIFDGIDFFQVWVYLMFHRWDTLAKHFVQLPEAPVRSHAEVIAFLKSRMRPMGSLTEQQTVLA